MHVSISGEPVRPGRSSERQAVKIVRAVVGVAIVAAGVACAEPASALPWYVTNTTFWVQDAPGFPTNSRTTADVSSSDSFCYLRYVTGHFVGDGEQVQVYADSGLWYIGGTSSQDGLAAGMNCIPYYAFTPEPGGVDDLIGSAGLLNTGPTDGGGCGFNLFGLDCTLSPGFGTNAWQGDAAIMVSGMTGQFDGGGEHVDALQSDDPWAYNQLFVAAQSPNGVGGWSEMLFVGVPQSGFKPAFYGPTSGIGDALNAGEYSVSASSSNPSARVIMAPTSQAFCYFTGIGGAFAGGGESVDIDTVMSGGVEYWSLNATSQQANGTYANARCYMMNQSQSM
jgi:hypothetical protein